MDKLTRRVVKRLRPFQIGDRVIITSMLRKASYGDYDKILTLWEDRWIGRTGTIIAISGSEKLYRYTISVEHVTLAFSEDEIDYIEDEK